LAKENNLFVQPISAGEFPHFAHLLKRDDLVVCVSQSGETADVLEAVKSAHKAKSKVLSLVNVMGSSLMRMSDSSILTKAGPEICVLSTKAYVSQQAMFVMLSAALKGDLKIGRKVLKTAKEDIENILSKTSQKSIQKLAKHLAKADNIYALGRGTNYPNALEACLKIKEVSYIHAEGFAGGDLKHGPIALIEKGVPVLVFAANDESEKEIVSNAMEVKARGAEVIGVATQKNQVFDEYLPVQPNGFYTPLASIVYPQLLAYYIALEKKLDPDKPRNLAKSVTVK
jgi:glucosamine--fructose-6-phosphate aminotransferase (isomerizing)